MVLLQNKPCQFYGRQKICLQTKFELSKLILALSQSNFLFRPLNKLSPLVGDIKIGYAVPAHLGQDTFVGVASRHVQEHLCCLVGLLFDPHNCTEAVIYILNLKHVFDFSGCGNGA